MRNKSEGAILKNRPFADVAAPNDEDFPPSFLTQAKETSKPDTSLPHSDSPDDELGYVSDVCDYNIKTPEKSLNKNNSDETLGEEGGVLTGTLSLSIGPDNSSIKIDKSTKVFQKDDSYLHSQVKNSPLVSCWLKKAVSPNMEISHFDRSQALVQKRASIFENNCVHNNNVSDNLESDIPLDFHTKAVNNPAYVPPQSVPCVDNHNSNHKKHLVNDIVLQSASVVEMDAAAASISSQGPPSKNIVKHSHESSDRQVDTDINTFNIVKPFPSQSNKDRTDDEADYTLLGQQTTGQMTKDRTDDEGDDSQLSRQSSVDDNTIESKLRGRRSSNSRKSSTIKSKIQRRKMMREANMMDNPAGALSGDDNDQDSVEEKQDSESIHDDENFNSKKSSINNNKFIPSVPPEYQKVSMSELTPETARRIKDWNSRFTNIKSSFDAASEHDDADKSRSPSMQRIETADFDGRGRSRFKDKGQDLPRSKSAHNMRTPRTSTTSQPEIIIQSDSRTPENQRAPSKEDKNKNNALIASTADSNKTASISSSKERSPATRIQREDDEYLQYLSSVDRYRQNNPKPMPIRPTAARTDAIANPMRKADGPIRQQSVGSTPQSKSKQLTPVRENNALAARISKSVPKEVNKSKDLKKEESQAEILGLVRTNRETGQVEKTNDMDYEDYMNIINKVRKTKESTRVRTEQIRLASMYAQERKRQQEIKVEEERLQIEYAKIEEESKNTLPIITTVASLLSTKSDENLEKGQIDNNEQEQFMKVSPKISPSPIQPSKSESSLPSHVDTSKAEWEKQQKILFEQEQEKVRQQKLLEQSRQEQVRNEQIKQQKLKEEQARNEQIRQQKEEQARNELIKQQQEEQARSEQLKQQKEELARNEHIKQQKQKEEQVRNEQIKQEQIRKENEQELIRRKEIERLEFEQEQLKKKENERLEQEQAEMKKKEIERLEQIKEEQKKREEEQRKQEEIKAFYQKQEQINREKQQKIEEQLQQEKIQEQARQEQIKIEQIRNEQIRQQQLREEQVQEEQRKLEQLKEVQIKKEKEREEIRRLEFDRLQQIREDQKRLEEERHKQQERMRQEQARIEDERRKQEKLQKERQELYSKQQAEMEANVGIPKDQMQFENNYLKVDQMRHNSLSPNERLIVEKLRQQELLREEQLKEEAQIRKEKLKLIHQEEELLTRQDEMLQQIQEEKVNLAKQEDMIRSRQQSRLQQVRSEKALLEKQEHMLKMREEQLLHERKRQEKLRDEATALRKQEESIKRRQEEIAKELLQGDMSVDDVMVCQAREGQVFVGPKPYYPETMLDSNIVNVQLLTSDWSSSDAESLMNTTKTTNTNTDSRLIKKSTPTDTTQSSNTMHTYMEANSNFDNPPFVPFKEEEEIPTEEQWTGSSEDEDTLDEDGCYECKVEVKQQNTSVPTSVRTIETVVDVPGWAPITPYLNVSKSVTTTQEEVSAIFSEAKTSGIQYKTAGIITSPDSVTSTHLITTPDSSISLQSQISMTDELSFESSSWPGSPMDIPPVPPPPKESKDLMPEPFQTVQPDVPPRDDSFAIAAVYSTVGSVTKSEQPIATQASQRRSLIEDLPRSGNIDLQFSPRIGGPGSAFKPYASNENLYDPLLFPRNAADPASQRPPVSLNMQQNNGDRHSKRYSNSNMKPPKISESDEEYFRPRPRPSKVNKVVTTDTEPEMREFNLAPMGGDKKSKKQKPMYSTSETEEEYQAYLKSKPKWHGKGGHKDSWDPLQIASPPQIVQRPVGVVQKPKPQAQIAQKIERGAQVYPVSLQIYPGVTLAEQMRQLEENPTVPIFANRGVLQNSKSQVSIGESSKVNNILEPPNYERIQKSGSIIELREKQNLVPNTERIQKSSSVVEVKPVIASKQFIPDSNNSIMEHPYSPSAFGQPAQLIKQDPKNLQQTLPVTTTQKEMQGTSTNTDITQPSTVKERTPLTPVKEGTPLTQQVPVVGSLQIPTTLSPNDSEDQATPKAPRKFYMPKQTSVDSTNSFSETEELLLENQAPQIRSSKEDPETKKKKEIHKNLMSEALKKVELRSNKQKKFNQLNRTNPTIAAIGLMTRKELKMEEMEKDNEEKQKSRNSSGNNLLYSEPLPNVPKFLNGTSNIDQSVLQQFKEQSIYKQQNTAKRTENQNAASRQALIQAKKAGTPKKPDTLPKPTSKDIGLEQQNPEPIVILKKQPRQLQPEELQARKVSMEKQKPEILSGKPSTPMAVASKINEPKRATSIEERNTAVKESSVSKENEPMKPKVNEPKTSTTKEAKRPTTNEPTRPTVSETSRPTVNEPIRATANEPMRSEVRSDSNKIINSENKSTLDKSAGQAKAVGGTANDQGQPITTTRKTSAPSKITNRSEEQVKAPSVVNSPQVKRALQPAVTPAGKPTRTRTPSVTDKEEIAARAIEKINAVQIAQQNKSLQKVVSAKASLPDVLHVTPTQVETVKENIKSDVEIEETVSEVKKNSSENEDKVAVVKKAAEKFESGLSDSQKSESETSSVNFKSYNRGRAKSFGNALLEQFEEDKDPVKNALKTNLPWAGKSPPVIKRRDALRNKGYALQMSKSSDSITAAKLLAEQWSDSQGMGGGLRINQPLSKSIERQIDIYSKTKEDIRKILMMAKSGSVTDRIKMFTGLIHKDQETPEVNPDEKADAIRREIQEARAQAQETVSDTEIDFQEPIESKVKPLKIRMKPKILNKPEKRETDNQKGSLRINQPEHNSPKLGLRINQPRHEDSPKRGLRINQTPKRDSPKLERHSSREDLPSVKSKIQNYLTAAEEPKKEEESKEDASQQENKGISYEDKAEATRRERGKKSPKLLSDHYLSAGQTLEIYAQSATDISADESEQSPLKTEVSKKPSEKRALSTKDPGPNYLQVPVVNTEQRTSGIMKSKSFASTNQFEGSLDVDSITSKKETMMAFFNANINKTGNIEKPAKHREKIARRNSITSITDEILGEEDLKNVDDEFESLLNSTFESETSRRATKQPGGPGNISEKARERAERQGVASHSSVGTGAGGSRGVGSDSAKRKVSEPVLGSAGMKTQLKKSPSLGNSSMSRNTIGAAITERRAGEEVVFAARSRSVSEDRATPTELNLYHNSPMTKHKNFDPLAALPTSQTKKYLPRQASLRSGTPPAQYSPSPTQSEYDTCDPWDDY